MLPMHHGPQEAPADTRNVRPSGLSVPVEPRTRPVAVARSASIRELWFGRYPLGVTIAAFVLALMATAGLSIDPTASAYRTIQSIDPDATGALYICYEVLLSFAGHEQAIALLVLGCLLTLPMRYVFFGRCDSWRPSVVLPALAFSACMVFGKSYDVCNSADLVLSGTTHIIQSLIAGVGWALLAHVSIYLVYEGLDWVGGHRLPFTETRYGRLWRMADACLNRHPFLVPFALLVLTWMPTFISAAPGLFMGDTGGQIRQWFNLPNGTSDYLNLVNPDVLLNGHHPVAHTALIGGCVELGLALFGSENAGALIYTTAQFLITAAVGAYTLSELRRFGIGLVARASVLAFLIFMPMFSNYAVLITKDVLFADAFVVLCVQMAKLLLPPARPGAAPLLEIEGSRACGVSISAAPVQVRITVRDWVLMASAALGCAFLRNGGVVFPLAACALAAVSLAVDARRARGEMPERRRYRRRALGVLALGALALASSLAFSNIVMPALDITPGSRREMLSIPFQQTARFVMQHDSAHAGIEGGTDDGLVSDYERQVIDRVLDYGTLASRYDEDKSDAVKAGFNESATSEDLAAYFGVWAQMFLRDPAAYISALANNYYGYFYPSERDVWVYSPHSSEEEMADEKNSAYFDFHPLGGTLQRACSDAVTLYRVAVQRIPLMSLTMSSAFYVWALILASVYLLRSRSWRALALVAPLWAVLAVCLIGPCNGSTYMRYLYPIICAAPFTLTVGLVYPRRLA